MPRLKEKYKKEIIGQFLGKEEITNLFQVPRLLKVVLNTSVGRAITEPKILTHAAELIAKISGQRPVITKAKKAISAFKLREGMSVGAKVTLRGDRMYEFIDRLVSIALPRIRDFRGLNDKAFDGNGNYTLGLKDITIFPEVQMETGNFGLEISIQTSATNDSDGRELLTLCGFPFKKEEK